MSSVIAAGIVGNRRVATGLNEFTSEGSGCRRMPTPRKGRISKPCLASFALQNSPVDCFHKFLRFLLAKRAKM